MKRILAILCLILAVSCAPRAIVVAPIAPRAARVAENAATTAQAATKAKRSTQEIGKQVESLNQEIIRGMLAADAIRKAGLATQAQLDANADAWQRVHARNLFLEAASKSAVIDASELEAAATRTRDESAGLATDAVKADAVVTDLKAENAKQSVDAARGKAVKHAVWLILGIGVLYLIIRFALPLIRPL